MQLHMSHFNLWMWLWHRYSGSTLCSVCLVTTCNIAVKNSFTRYKPCPELQFVYYTVTNTVVATQTGSVLKTHMQQPIHIELKIMSNTKHDKYQHKPSFSESLCYNIHPSIFNLEMDGAYPRWQWAKAGYTLDTSQNSSLQDWHWKTDKHSHSHWNDRLT